ncbi:MAG: sulfatase-like hydrolase/transferase [Nitrospirales bacterium]
MKTGGMCCTSDCKIGTKRKAQSMVSDNLTKPGTLIKASFTCLILYACAIQLYASNSIKQPNTILLMVDDCGWGDMQYRKDAYATPNMDALAHEGMIFTQSYAASPACSPCRATVISGQHAARLQLSRHIPRENPDGRTDDEFHLLAGDPSRTPSRNWLPLEVTTYAEALKGLGYQTGFVGKWHLGHESFHPIHQGFDKQYGVSNYGHPASYSAPFFGKQSEVYKEVPEGKYLTDQLTDDALDYLKTCSRDQPFHLTVFYYAAHTPFQGRKDLVEQLNGVITKKSNLHHAAQMMAVDESIARIRRYLKENGLEDDTALIFLGDQGSHFDNSPLRGGKRGGTAVYEGGARIPMCICWPGHITPNQTAHLVSTVDIFPTLVDLAGGKWQQRDKLDGESLLGLAKDKEGFERDEVFLYRTYEDQYAAVREGDWKLVAYRSGKAELYNLKEDLSESKDLYTECPEKAETLRNKLAKWEKDQGVYLEPKSPPMGWNSWNFFGKREINEQIVIEVIDAFVDQGLKEAGYEYVVIDGGWRDNKLGSNHQLLPHPEKFPNGIKPLADYAHARGLKLGLHTVPGHRDCGGDRVGAFGYEAVHVQQFIDWGVDYIKLDKCLFNGGWDEEVLKETYFKWYRLLKQSPHDILFSICAYEYRDWYPEIADIARTTYDISCKKFRGANFDDSKQGFMPIADLNNTHADHARNGYWNDPDILVVGNGGLTEAEQKIHFAIWCLASAPLMLGNDPRNMSDFEKDILMNPRCIAINQDATEQGRKLLKEGDKEVWAKKLEDGSHAVLLLNRNKTEKQTVEFDSRKLGLTGKARVIEIFSGSEMTSIEGVMSRELGPHEGWFVKVSGLMLDR